MTRRRIPVWAYVLAALLLMGGVWFGWPRQQNANVAKPAAPPSVSVTVASVTKVDFPVYLTGLGTVQGFNTVTVRTRVDGQINQIAFKEGQFVKAGDLIAQIDPRPFQAALDQANAKKAQDEANLANAQRDLARSTKLGEFATKQTVDTQTANVEQLKAQISADEAAIFNAQTQLDYASIRAPISGITGIRQVDVGNIVNAATQTGIVTIAQVEPISVIFTAPEEQLPDIASALRRGETKVTALTTDGRKVLSQGVLSLMNNQVDSTSGTIRLKATFDNKDHALWPGLSVSTRLLVNTIKDATVMPDDAVQHGNDGLYVYVVTDGNKAGLRKIKIGPSTDGKTLVDSGVTAGEQVVTAGQYRVQPGSALTVNVASSGQTSAKAD
ncbi:MAG TPA: efflux RND transporter periplasmic adaptor subunit [Afipia sp.]|uniref:efflux RND transporter periplasmic adaptor subunit n=1 Tax=unclassified Afipia TaxID=2642050 RepID=UPI0004659E5F|nr:MULTISPECIES: efflux RND transporter periplasmic adaptor subunit [unclassified Afipia]MAH72056.1 efflux RND transporter periplasmic adaptor subunit [Afipia sp.]OUX58673.1 MAG: efflux transporter periplasmic adaptor subunit [Afipia sp. TMED4]HAO41061.1 efflux RND transporter periplasmic adaptor subunit [Afipia sp.]HAP13815.1 efflux RND transporter periplasmic adaptor subunit [Afipia sp.]HAP47020.1 efflux RND transporter periplasmic adaptor subunit [Afipia sp.]